MSPSPRAPKRSSSSRIVSKAPSVSSVTCHSRILSYQDSESMDSTSKVKSILNSCNIKKASQCETSQCEKSCELGLSSIVNKDFVQNKAHSKGREKSSIPVKKNLHLHFFPSTISCSDVYTSSEYDNVKSRGGRASTCSTTSAKFQDTEGNSNCGENKNTEGGILVFNEDSSKNARVNVSSLINFYNSLSTVQIYTLK